jgi:uncharacterized protein (TIGR02996 family)
VTRADALRAVIADPDADAPRLAFAEWCEANGEPDRGEFIRIQLQQARQKREPANGWSSFAWDLPSSWVAPPLVAGYFSTDWALQKRRNELVEANDEWRAELPADWPNEYTEHERGFVRQLDVPPTLLRFQPERFFDLGPITELKLNARGGAAWPGVHIVPELVSIPYLARIRHLHFGVVGSDFVSAFVRAFATSPHAAGLTRLDLDNKTLDPDTLSAIAGSPYLERLERLSLAGNPLEPESLQLLASTHRLPNLRHLRLSGCSLTPELMRAFLDGPLFGNLDTLELGWNATLGADGVAALAADPRLARFRCLGLNRCGIDRAACDRLAASRYVGELETLGLESNPLGDGLSAILESPAFASLHTLKARNSTLGAFAPAARVAPVRRLDLSKCAVGDGGVAALVRSPLLRGLTHLRLRECGITSAGAAALAACDALTELRELDLSENPIGDAGATALADGPALREVWDLKVSGCELTERGLFALAELPGLGRYGLRHDIELKKKAEARLKAHFDARPIRRP